jgi:hypothetical protein
VFSQLNKATAQSAPLRRRVAGKFAALHMSASGTKRTSRDVRYQVRYRVQSGLELLNESFSAFDPYRTSSSRLASRLNCHDTLRMGDHHAGGAEPGVNFNATPFMQ